MRTDRTGILPELLLGLVAAATVWTAMVSWRGFTTDATPYLVDVAVAGTVLAAVGAVARWRRLPWPLVLVVQLVVAAAVTGLLVAGSLFPSEVLAAIRDAFDDAQQFASPVPEDATTSVTPVLVVGGVVALLLVDLLAGSLRRVPLAGLPLLTLYTVPVSMLDDTPAWWVFAASAAGFLLMLYLQEQQLVGRWGRSLEQAEPEAGDPGPSGGPQVGPTAAGAAGAAGALANRGAAVRLSALGIGTVTILAAVVVPQVVPTLSLSVFEMGRGGGDDADIKIVNPMVDLVRDGLDPDRPDIPLVRVTTDDEQAPRYLRISVLNRFSGNDWSSGDRVVPDDQVAQGEMPPLQGLGDTSGVREHDYRVVVTDDFDSTWLPTQAPISSIDAEGDWRYDTSTMDFIASQDDLNAAGQTYTMTSLELPDPTTLIAPDAPPTDDSISPELLEVPDLVTTEVRSLAEDVTQNADTPFEEAQALQAWFRRDGGFTYSVARAPVGNGANALETFLDADAENGRTGYCEQFSAAMAAMARSLGIPSRVAVGFLQANLTNPATRTYTYSSRSLHAWTELYFPGAGWVLFDPTPVTDGPAPPRYTTENAPAPAGQDDEPSASPSASPSTAPDVPSASAPTSRPRVPEETPSATDTAAGQSDGGFPWVTLLVWLVVLAVLVGLAFVPRSARGALRARRARGGPEAAWDELRATTVDLGHPWVEGRSPRETGVGLAALFGWPEDPAPDTRPRRGPDQSPEATAALERIVTALEQLRYAPEHVSGAGELAEDVDRVCAALAAGTQPRVRRRAEWLPVSLLQRGRARALLADEDALV